MDRLTEKQRRLATRAWQHALPVIARWERRWPRLDFSGPVALRITTMIHGYDRQKAHLEAWTRIQADYACREAVRQETNRPQVMPLDREEEATATDPPGHLEQMDSLEELLRGSNRAERTIAMGYYYHDLTLRQAGQLAGLGQQRTRQVHNALIARLRERGHDY